MVENPKNTRVSFFLFEKVTQNKVKSFNCGGNGQHVKVAAEGQRRQLAVNGINNRLVEVSAAGNGRQATVNGLR